MAVHKAPGRKVSAETLISTLDAERGAELREFIDRVDNDRFLDVLDLGQPAELYRRSCNEVQVVAVLAGAIAPEQHRRLTEFRIAQYLRIGFVDPARLIDTVRTGQPLSPVTPDDVHVLTMTGNGTMLCAALLRALPDTPTTVRMGDRDRALFPLEQVHGWGVLNRLRVLRDLRAGRVRELSGFVKNQALPMSELTIRGPVEIGVAMFRLVTGVLHVDAMIGDVEESVAKSNLDFFGGRPVLVTATVPCVPESSFLAPRYEGRSVYPFALLVSDGSRGVVRLEAIEEALAKPGHDGLMALLQLKQNQDMEGWSTLVPDEVGAALARAELPHQRMPMASRRELADLADQLLGLPLLSSLSRGEAAVLSTCLTELTAAPGETVIGRGDQCDALYLVAAGQALATCYDETGEAQVVGLFGPGDYFGEAAVLVGGAHTWDVVAASRLRLWRLSNADYERYLGDIVEVDLHLHRTAASRAYRRLTDRPSQ